MAAVDHRGLLRLIARHGRWVLTTHINPDGDAIGSQLAVASLIRRLGAPDVDVRIINSDPVPQSLEFVAQGERFETYEPAVHDTVIAEADVVVGLDNSEPTRFGRVMDSIRSSGALRVCIDHHPEPDPFWDLLYVDEDACSTAEVIHGLYRARGVEPGGAVAMALYVALFSDTGRFRFTNTDDAAFSMASELVRSGARPAFAYSMLEERMSGEYLAFLGHVVAGAATHADGRVSVLRAPLSLVERHGVQGADLGEIINLVLRVESTRVAGLFREIADGRTKISLRSKGALDVNRLARLHGGGGHRNASGVILDLPLERAIEQILPDLEALASAGS
jgi:phosphoesterase RecJ-like protein